MFENFVGYKKKLNKNGSYEEHTKEPVAGRRNFVTLCFLSWEVQKVKDEFD